MAVVADGRRIRRVALPGKISAGSKAARQVTQPGETCRLLPRNRRNGGSHQTEATLQAIPYLGSHIVELVEALQYPERFGGRKKVTSTFEPIQLYLDLDSVLVSILIPCYNAAQWVGQAIESALSQTWAEKEVVSWMTAPPIGAWRLSKPLMAGSAGKQVLIREAMPHAIVPSRSRGAMWVQYLDADDYLLETKIAKQMDFVKSHTDVAWCLAP